MRPSLYDSDYFGRIYMHIGTAYAIAYVLDRQILSMRRQAQIRNVVNALQLKRLIVIYF